MATVNVKKPTTPVSTAPAPAAPPVGQDWIRQYLKNKGVADSSIGYNNGQVTFGGGGSIKPTTNVNGQSYAPTADLDKAWNSYQMNQGQQKLGGAQSAYESAVNTPYAAYTAAQPFTYNKDTDPAYQAALQSAQAGAQTASNNAMVSLGSRGIGNSSSNKTAVAQIEQNALGSVTRDVLPQLISQSYQRYADGENQRYQQYKDQYSMTRDHTADLGNVVGMQQGVNQQLSAEDQRKIDNARNSRNDNLSAANQVSQLTGKVINPQSDWTGLFRQAENPNTPLTLQGQGQQFGQNMQTKQFDQAKYESDRAYRQQVQQQSIANGQWQQQFNMDVDKFGFQQASELWSQAFQMNQSNQDNALKLSQADKDAAYQATGAISKSGLVTTTTDPFTGQEATNVTNPDSLSKYIISLGLSDNATDSLLYQYGLDSYVKK